MEELKCAIIDDDPVCLMSLQDLTGNHSALNLIGTYSCLEDFYNQKPDIDLLFLDLELGDKIGFELFEKEQGFINFHVIAISAKKEYGVDSYDYNIVDYIIKPITEARLNKALDKVTVIENTTQVNSEKESVFIKEGGAVYKLHFDDIYYIEALSDYVKINSSKKNLTILSTMKNLERKLPSNFLRVHRSFIINLNHIDKIEDDHVQIFKVDIPIGKTYKKVFYSKIDLFL